jgi:hypothetical protein
MDFVAVNLKATYTIFILILLKFSRSFRIILVCIFFFKLNNLYYFMFIVYINSLKLQ